MSQKLAALGSFVNRSIDIPLSKDDREMEIKIIKQIAQDHNFDPNIVNKLIQKKLLRNLANNSYLPTTNTSVGGNTERFFSLMFNGDISYKIQKICSRHNIKIAFKSKNTLSNFFINNKDKIDPLLNPGVYQLACGCGKIYIGRTKRNFKTRFSEHCRCVGLNNTESLFAKHILETGHQTDFKNNHKILHVESNNAILNNLEALEIIRSTKDDPDRIINSQTSFLDNRILSLFFQ
ncbi:unnamed protein product [Ceutorhynchus assimilis]|uniref:GIY-YIG domain-containing protein n=1 Tax=Ceutorhynchus assimilis TaxID=467358 RepID=A0A9N9QMR8_9CUCU|nr:unnamed protein product [Ceutorhynchus assimilis]